MSRNLHLLTGIILAVSVGSALAQGTNVSLGGESHDPSAPVEVAADELSLDQGSGTAVFRGNVRVGQGALRLAANEVTVFYVTDGGQITGDISRVLATGNVALTNGAESAEAASADYSVASGTVAMSGDVMLTQGQNALSGDSLFLDLVGNTARMEGRVRTLFSPQAGQ